MSVSALFEIDSLGLARRPTPIRLPRNTAYVNDDQRLLYNPHLAQFQAGVKSGAEPESFELAGPRAQIYFEPNKVKAGIVTCGGLCPGLNAVIRALVLQLCQRYGVRDVLGIRYGYHGLAASARESFTALRPGDVESIHEEGGTVLGASRGSPPTAEMVDVLQAKGINILFTIGGDGTMRGALALSEEAKRRGVELCVVGIPKTIDNDIPFVRRSFGFESAVAVATQAIQSAYIEASDVRNGIGLVKLMGRNSGYIAANATLASGHVDVCLVPEVAFELEGPNGLLALVEARVKDCNHCVIVVAEGAGQSYFTGQPVVYDSSGNARLGDIGTFLKERFEDHFRGTTPKHVIRYIDPSYLIRTAPANPADALFCARLAQNAAHAAMCGKTAMLVGYWHGAMTHVPMRALASGRQTINPQGELWATVIETTGQPSRIGDGD